MGYPALYDGSMGDSEEGKDIQQGDKAEGEKDETTKVCETSASEHASAAVVSSITTRIGIVEEIIWLWMVWRKIGAPQLRVWRKRKLEKRRVRGREGV